MPEEEQQGHENALTQLAALADGSFLDLAGGRTALHASCHYHIDGDGP